MVKTTIPRFDSVMCVLLTDDNPVHQLFGGAEGVLSILAFGSCKLGIISPVIICTLDLPTFEDELSSEEDLQTGTPYSVFASHPPMNLLEPDQEAPST